ncbi:MAG: (2Fe-2S)-binding protein [Kiloniellales bacterium]
MCICNGYRDSELRELARDGIACAVQAYKHLGQGPNCGRCLPVAQQVIDQARRSDRATARNELAALVGARPALAAE